MPVAQSVCAVTAFSFRFRSKPPTTRPAPTTNPIAIRSSGGIKLCSNEYFTKNAMPRKSASPPIHANNFAPMNCSQSIGGLVGLAICGALGLRSSCGIGGGSGIALDTTGAGVIAGIGDGTASTFGSGAATGASGCTAETVCGRKLRSSFSRDDNRLARSSTPRFALFAFASATNGRTRIAMRKPIIRKPRNSIGCWGLAGSLRLCDRG